MLLLIVAALVVIAFMLFGGKSNDQNVTPDPQPTVQTVNANNVTQVQQTQPQTQPQQGGAAMSPLADLLAEEGSDLSQLQVEQVDVSDLSITPGLPEEWINILLLGTDERTFNEAARTDTMIICSINKETGEVKLSSILRDVAVRMDDLGENSGTYRINSANFFGGPKYAMKLVNECFDMNIQKYVSVNFFGFKKIADVLGGIEVDISEAEMNEINRKQYDQLLASQKLGIATRADYTLLETFGENTHLDGNQTLAYARVRAVDSDISRAERQRRVLIKLKEKLKGRSIMEITALAASQMENVSMNFTLDELLGIALKVIDADLSNVKTLRLPEAGTYVEERRNDKAMIFDTDFEKNALTLYNFIYE